jgi:hypothetical protein
LSARKILAVVIALALAGYGYYVDNPTVLDLPGQSQAGGQNEIATAYENRQSDVQVQGVGLVLRILRDDNTGSRHQKFILEIPSGQTILISHNIDLAGRHVGGWLKHDGRTYQ